MALDQAAIEAARSPFRGQRDDGLRRGGKQRRRLGRGSFGQGRLVIDPLQFHRHSSAAKAARRGNIAAR